MQTGKAYVLSFITKYDPVKKEGRQAIDAKIVVGES